MSPILLVEDDWMAQAVQPQLEELVGPIVSVPDFAGLIEALDRVATETGSGEPVVVLDPGIPGVCRLDAVRRTLLLEPRARVVLWSGARDPSFLAAALLDGAVAALHKQKSLETLALAVRRAAVGRFSCEPEIAQALADLLSYLDRCRERQGRSDKPHVWTFFQIERMTFDPKWIDMLEELASGEPLEDDRWFAFIVTYLRGFWLDPYLRRALMALAVSPSREQAGVLLGKPVTTVHGYCSRLAALLMPTQYPADEMRDRAGGLTLANWIIRNHAGCELPDVDHDIGLGDDVEPMAGRQTRGTRVDRGPTSTDSRPESTRRAE